MIITSKESVYVWSINIGDYSVMGKYGGDYRTVLSIVNDVEDAFITLFSLGHLSRSNHYFEDLYLSYDGFSLLISLKGWEFISKENPDKFGDSKKVIESINTIDNWVSEVQNVKG